MGFDTDHPDPTRARIPRVTPAEVRAEMARRHAASTDPGTASAGEHGYTRRRHVVAEVVAAKRALLDQRWGTTPMSRRPLHAIPTVGEVIAVKWWMQGMLIVLGALVTLWAGQYEPVLLIALLPLDAFLLFRLYKLKQRRRHPAPDDERLAS